MSLIVAAAGASMTVLFRAAENNRNLLSDTSSGAASASAQTAVARAAVDMLCADLKVATSIVNVPQGLGGFALTLTVPGRYAGDSSETLVYQWNGPGTSLMRQLNSNPAISIADNVQVLDLTMISKSVGPGGG